MGTRNLIAVIVFAWLALTGCGRKGPKLADPVPVSGTVTLDGKPLANATVYFKPDGGDAGNGASGVTDADGKYELSITERGSTKKGAVPGKYRVYFSQMVGPDGKPIEVDPDTPPANVGGRESLPLHLSDSLQTEERAAVGESGGTFDFKLSKKKKAAGPGLMPR